MGAEHRDRDIEFLAEQADQPLLGGAACRALAGVGAVRNSNEAASTSASTGALVCSDQAFELLFDQPFSQLCVAMPSEWLADRLGTAPADLAIRHIDTRTSLGGIVRAAISGLIHASDVVEGETCSDLFAQALRGATRKPGQALVTIGSPRLLIRIEQLIQRRLGDPALTPVVAAAELGCSLSSFHQHCQNGGRSFGGMLQRELDAAAIELRRTAASRRNIGTIAYECGFTDPSHFARLFKARFGSMPRNYR